MNKLLAISFVLPLVFALGCESSGSGTAPAASGSVAKPAPAGETKPATTAEAKPAPPPEAKPASAAAALLATALPSKDLADFTIGLPAGAKLEAAGDRSTLDSSDYRLNIKVDPKPPSVAELKGMVSKMKTFKSVITEDADGMVAEFEEPKGKEYIVQRSVKAGDKTITCETTLTKPAKTAEKAKEAFDVCGTIKKK